MPHVLTIVDRGPEHVHRWNPHCDCGWRGVNRRRRRECERQYRAHLAAARNQARRWAEIGEPQELTPAAEWPEAWRMMSEPQDSDVRLSMPALVATSVAYCVTHRALDHDAGRACRFRQLFYFENPMDEHTLMWADEW